MKTWTTALILCLALLLLGAALTFAVWQLSKERKLPRKKKWWAFALTIVGALTIAAIVLTTTLLPSGIEKHDVDKVRTALINSETEKVIKKEKTTELTSQLEAEGKTQKQIDKAIEKAVKEYVESAEFNIRIEANTADEVFMQKVEGKIPSEISKRISAAVMKTLSVLSAVVLMSFALILMLLYGGRESLGKGIKGKYFSSKNLTCIATFSAISSILYIIVKFPLPIFPSFLDIQISDMPALLAGFMMGPQAGVAVIFIKTLIKLPFTGTNGVGELADIILGIAFVLPASIIYRFKRTKKGALIGLCAGCLVCVATALVVNRFIVIPFYVAVMFDGSWAPLLGMVKPLYPNVTEESFYKYFLWLAVLPFNLLRCVASAFVTFVLYKSLSRAFNKIFTVRDKPLESAECRTQNDGENSPLKS